MFDRRDRRNNRIVLMDEKEIVRITKEFIESDPWSGEEMEKLGKFDEFLASLCEEAGMEAITFYVPPEIEGSRVGLGNAMASTNKALMRIAARKYSLVSCLWGFHRLLHESHPEEASIWAAKVYSLAAPEKYKTVMDKKLVRPLDIEAVKKDFEEKGFIEVEKPSQNPFSGVNGFLIVARPPPTLEPEEGVDEDEEIVDEDEEDDKEEDEDNNSSNS